MKKPNLFIIGAPKCGTTSVIRWLSQHPDIFLPPEKEPHFFSTDVTNPYRKNLDEYLQLFKGAGDERYLLEGSTRYLYSKVATNNIINFNPSSKFIVLIRNPTDLVISLHNHLYQIGTEPEKRLSRAWELQEKRKNSSIIKKFNPDPDSLQYKEIASLGSQLERALQIIPPSNLKIIIFDDLKSAPYRTFSSITTFLNTPSPECHDLDLTPHNQAFECRSLLLKEIVKVSSIAKRLFGIKGGFGILSKMKSINAKRAPSAEIDLDLYKKINASLEEEVEKLSTITGKDLSAWKVPQKRVYKI